MVFSNYCMSPQCNTATCGPSDAVFAVSLLCVCVRTLVHLRHVRVMSVGQGHRSEVSHTRKCSFSLKVKLEITVQQHKIAAIGNCNTTSNTSHLVIVTTSSWGFSVYYIIPVGLR